MILWPLFFSTFLLIFVSELGDKSQMVAFSLSARGHHPAALFLGSASALILSGILAALAGGAVSAVIPRFLPWLAGSLFILLGILILLRKPEPTLEESLAAVVSLETFLADNLPEQCGQIAREEAAHAEQIDLLFLGKDLDRIIKNPPADLLKEIAAWELRLRKENISLTEMPLKEALPKIGQMEELSYRFYEMLLNELNMLGGHEKLKAHLKETLQEEERHIAWFRELSDKAGSCHE